MDENKKKTNKSTEFADELNVESSQNHKSGQASNNSNSNNSSNCR